MILLLVLQVLTFAIIVFFGIFIFLKNPKASVNRAFALFAAGVAGWNLSIFLILVRSSLLWGRLGFSFCAMWAGGLLWFVHLFPEPTKHWKAWRNIGLVLGVIFFAIPASPYMIKSIAIVDGHITGELVPLPYLLWDAFFLLSLLYAMIRAWIRTAKSKGLSRNQLRAVTIGITAFLLPFLITNILLPLIANDFRWNNLGPLFTIFLIAFLTHAIVSYRFLSIRWVIKKSFDIVFLWVIAFAIVWGGYVLLTGSFPLTWIQIVIATIFAFCFGPISSLVSRWSAFIASRGSYVYDDAVGRITELVHNSLDLPTLQQRLGDLLREYFGFSRMALIAFASEKPDTPLKTMYRGFSPEIVKAIPGSVHICSMDGRGIVESSELRWRLMNNVKPESAKIDREILQFMQSWGISTMMSFCVGDGLVGVAFFGERPRGELLTDQDIALLNVLRGSAAPAMANGVRFSEMKRLYSQLLSLDKSKSEFIDVVSHHFRTPLTSILWNTELSLEDRSLPAKSRDAFIQIHERAAYLNVTLNRIFDLLSIENRQIAFERKPLELREVVRAALDEQRRVIEERGLKVETELEPAMMYGDREKMLSVVRIIIENACQFSRRRGRIHIRLSVDRAKRLITLQVEDKGIGIPEEDLAHIFDKFFRASNAKKSVADGAGVSMYLAKRFIEKQRGTVDVRSSLGKGTVVTVTFPSVEA